ncbi:MAG: aldo/keto reductase [Fibrobacterota bacterium]
MAVRMQKKRTPDSRRYDGMVYRRCGRSGLLLSAVSLGLWHNFGGVDNAGMGQKIIFRAFDLGITHFDLANNYGPPPGSAESFFGKVLKTHLASYRDELVVSTKAGYRMWPGPYGDFGSRKYLLSSLDQSLKRLRLDHVDIFYSHRPDPDTPLEETAGALASAVLQGKALYAGVSNYGPAETAKIAALLRTMGTPCLIHQPKYSMMVRGLESGLAEVLAAEGIGCTPFSPLAQGLLTDRYLHGIPKGSRASKPHGFLKPDRVTEDVLNRVRRLNTMAQARVQTLAQMAVAWVLRLPVITSVLVGASSVRQIEDNVAALQNTAFVEQELAEIDRLFPVES